MTFESVVLSRDRYECSSVSQKCYSSMIGGRRRIFLVDLVSSIFEILGQNNIPCVFVHDHCSIYIKRKHAHATHQHDGGRRRAAKKLHRGH